MITVVIADDEALVRGGLRMILDASEAIDVIGEADDGGPAVALTRSLRPDVVLMDVRMPTMDGIEATRRITRNDVIPTRVLMLTTFDRDEYVYEAMKAGASGFMLKSAPPEQLVAAVHVVAAGEALLAPTITRRFVEDFVRRPPPGTGIPRELDELTDRELDVLRMLARGLSNQQISEALFLGQGTVKTHINRIFRKLDLRDRAQAVVVAYETGLVRVGDQQPSSTEVND